MVERTLHLLSILNSRAKKKGRNSWWILAKEGESGDEILKFESFAQTCLQEYTSSQCTAPRTNHKEHCLISIYLSGEILVSWMKLRTEEKPRTTNCSSPHGRKNASPAQILMLLNCRRRRRRSWDEQLMNRGKSSCVATPWLLDDSNLGVDQMLRIVQKPVG